MTQQLLVPLRGGDRIQDVLPYVQGIAQPGMAVVFMVHFGRNRFKELAAQLLTINSGLRANFDSDSGSPTGGPGGISHLEQRIQWAADELRQRGVAIKVTFYTGSLRRLVRQCVENGPVKCVIMRPARSRILRMCHAAAAALGVRGLPAPSPVLLLFSPNGLASEEID